MVFTIKGMSVTKSIFPANSRNFAGMRWVSIGLRTLHLVGIAGIGGAFLQQTPIPDVATPYLWITLVSGVAMLALEIWCNGIFLIQLRGMAILVKLLLLALLLYLNIGVYVLITVIVISGIISHAPAKVRYFKLFKRIPLSNESLS